MKYYEIKQDKKLYNTIQFEGFGGCPNIIMDRNVADTFKRCTSMYVTGNPESQYPDLIQSPVLMISEKMFQILKYYDTSVIYKIVVLTDMKRNRQEVYRLMLPRIFELPVEVQKEQRIFYIKEGIEHHLIVTGNVLESILAREHVGICYEQVDIKGWKHE